MKDAQKPDHVSLNTLIGRMREGRFVIPDFQREFEWAPWDIRDLMRSIFSDYYIGSLLLWKPDLIDEFALSYRSIDMRSEVKRGVYYTRADLVDWSNRQRWASTGEPLRS